MHKICWNIKNICLVSHKDKIKILSLLKLKKKETKDDFHIKTYDVKVMTFCVGEMYLFIQKQNGGENVGKHNFKANYFSKVSFFGECTKMQLITSQNVNIQTCFSQFLWVFSLKCWFKGLWKAFQ